MPLEPLTDRQREILDFIHRETAKNGYSPTIREIGQRLGIRSTNGVNDHLKALERKGYLKRDADKSRTLRVVARRPADAPPVRALVPPSATLAIPLLGRVAAGEPILAEEHAQGHVHVDSFFLGTTKKVFALKVVGESMIDDGIHDGDFLFVKKQPHAERGDIVVAMIEGEATVKRYYPEGDRVRFQPANARMQPIYVHKDEFRQTDIMGVVVGIYRQV